RPLADQDGDVEGYQPVAGVELEPRGGETVVLDLLVTATAEAELAERHADESRNAAGLVATYVDGLGDDEHVLYLKALAAEVDDQPVALDGLAATGEAAVTDDP